MNKTINLHFCSFEERLVHLNGAFLCVVDTIEGGTLLRVELPDALRNLDPATNTALGKLLWAANQYGWHQGNKSGTEAGAEGFRSALRGLIGAAGARDLEMLAREVRYPAED